jgi:hypothetical protein
MVKHDKEPNSGIKFSIRNSKDLKLFPSIVDIDGKAE